MDGDEEAVGVVVRLYPNSRIGIVIVMQKWGFCDLRPDMLRPRILMWMKQQRDADLYRK